MRHWVSKLAIRPVLQGLLRPGGHRPRPPHLALYGHLRLLLLTRLLSGYLVVCNKFCKYRSNVQLDLLHPLPLDSALRHITKTQDTGHRLQDTGGPGRRERKQKQPGYIHIYIGAEIDRPMLGTIEEYIPDCGGAAGCGGNYPATWWKNQVIAENEMILESWLWSRNKNKNKIHLYIWINVDHLRSAYVSNLSRN